MQPCIFRLTTSPKLQNVILTLHPALDAVTESSVLCLFFAGLHQSTFICVRLHSSEWCWLFQKNFPPQTVSSFSSLVQFTTVVDRHTAACEPYPLLLSSWLAGLCNTKAKLHTYCIHHFLLLWPTQFYFFIYFLNSLSTPIIPVLTLSLYCITQTHIHREGWWSVICLLAHKSHQIISSTNPHTHTRSLL